MKKAVIIIEDNIREFENIKSIIDGEFVCKQNYDENSFSIFRENLRNSLIVNHADPKLQSKKKKELIKELKKYSSKNEQPVYLIDYLLDGDTANNKTGTKFRDKILKELYPKQLPPVMFLTNARNNNFLDVKAYCNDINDEKLCDVESKPDSDWDHDYLKKRIIGFIRNAQVKSIDNNEIIHQPKSKEFDLLNKCSNCVFDNDVRKETKNQYKRNLAPFIEGKKNLSNTVREALESLVLFDERNLTKINKLINNENK